MAGPGGTEVGRVSVRVVPDLDGFRDRVKRELQEVEGMEAQVKVTIDLTEFKAQIEEIKALLKSISDETVKVHIDKTGSAGSFAQDMKKAADNAENLGKAIKKSMGDGDTEGRISKVSRLLEGFGNFVQNAVRGAAELGSKMGGELASSARSFGSSLTSLIIQLTVWVPLLIGAAGALLYLVGVIAAAAAALPGLLFGIGAPIAAIILGMDGLKNAFKTLGPEFDKMKERLSNTFEKGFKPVVEGLKPLLPILSDGLNSTAEALGRFGTRFTDMINSTFRAGGAATNIENFKNALNGVPEFLDETSKGFVKFIESVIRAAGQSGALKIIGQTLSDVFTQLSGFFDQSIVDGSFMKGLENLRSTLDSITGMFVALLRNALKFFNGSAPGMNKFFDSLSSFFLSIDWERLGKAFGTVFERFGKAIESIPPQTIESITKSFEGLADSIGDLLDGKSFDVLIAGFQLMIDVVTGAIHILDSLLETIAHVGDFIEGIPDWFGTLFDKGGELLDGMKQGAIARWIDFTVWLGELPQKIRDFFSGAGTWLLERGQAIINGIRDGASAAFNNVTAFLQSIPGRILSFFVGAGTWLAETGRNIINGLGRGISGAWLVVQMTVADIKNRVISFFMGAGSWLMEAGRKIINGLVSGIRSAIPSIISILGSVTRMIPSWKGPPSTDAKLLFDNGQLIMQGLARGLQSGFQPVQSLLGDMTTDIGSAFGAPLIGDMRVSGADIAAVGTAQLNVAGSVDNGITEAVAAALSGWSVQLDETGMARLVNKGQQKLGRRG